MRRSARRCVAVGAAVAAGIGLTLAAPRAFAASDECPVGKYCLYDNPDYTGLLVASDTRIVRWIGDELNDRASSVINNAVDPLHLYPHVLFQGKRVLVHEGERAVLGGTADNQVSSYFLY